MSHHIKYTSLHLKSNLTLTSNKLVHKWCESGTVWLMEGAEGVL